MNKTYRMVQLPIEHDIWKEVEKFGPCIETDDGRLHSEATIWGLSPNGDGKYDNLTFTAEIAYALRDIQCMLATVDEAEMTLTSFEYYAKELQKAFDRFKQASGYKSVK